MELAPETWDLIGRYTGAGIALGFGGIGAAVGMGMAAGSASEAMMRQPSQHGVLQRTMLIGQAVGGDSSIFALVVGLLILFLPTNAATSGPVFASAMIGAGLSIGIGCFGSGWGCGWPAAAAVQGVARNPEQAGPVTSAMVIGQAVAQSPGIFSTVIALILLFVPTQGSGLAAAGLAIGAGISMGASALGPGIGSGTTAGGALSGISNWPATRAVVMRTMLIGQAVCQTPAIFGMLVAFIMIFTLPDLPADIVGFATVVGAAIAVGAGGIGPGIGCGMVGDETCKATSERPENDTLLMRTMLIGQAVAQSTAIYALIIALLMLYVI